MSKPSSAELICSQELMHGDELTPEEIALRYSQSQGLKQEIGIGPGQWRNNFEGAEEKVAIRAARSGVTREEMVQAYAVSCLPAIQNALEKSERFYLGPNGGYKAKKAFLKETYMPEVIAQYERKYGKGSWYAGTEFENAQG